MRHDLGRHLPWGPVPHPPNHGESPVERSEIHARRMYRLASIMERKPSDICRERHGTRHFARRTRQDIPGIHPSEECPRRRRIRFGTSHHTEACTSIERRDTPHKRAEQGKPIRGRPSIGKKHGSHHFRHPFRAYIQTSAN